MSLQTDYTESGLRAEDYIRAIWDETELTEDMLVDVDPGYLDPVDIEQAITSAIKDGPATQARKDFYKMLVFEFINQENGAVLDRYCLDLGNLEGNESAKREMLGQYVYPCSSRRIGSNRTASFSRGSEYNSVTTRCKSVAGAS